MSAPTNETATAREAARQDNGQFGTQPLAEADVDLDFTDPADVSWDRDYDRVHGMADDVVSNLPDTDALKDFLRTNGVAETDIPDDEDDLDEKARDLIHGMAADALNGGEVEEFLTTWGGGEPLGNYFVLNGVTVTLRDDGSIATLDTWDKVRRWEDNGWVRMEHGEDRGAVTRVYFLTDAGRTQAAADAAAWDEQIRSHMASRRTDDSEQSDEPVLTPAQAYEMNRSAAEAALASFDRNPDDELARSVLSLSAISTLSSLRAAGGEEGSGTDWAANRLDLALKVHNRAELKVEWDAAFADLKASGVAHDSDDPVAARYREASNAVNHANRKLDFCTATGEDTSRDPRKAADGLAGALRGAITAGDEHFRATREEEK